MNKPSTAKNRPFKISPEQTVRELVVNFPSLRPHLERLGIDYCCGGDRPLLETDLHEHIHLENNILFPKSLEQESTMNS